MCDKKYTECIIVKPGLTDKMIRSLQKDRYFDLSIVDTDSDI